MIVNRAVDRVLAWITLAAAAYTAATLVRYYLSPGVPRFPVESAFFILVGVGVLGVLLRGSQPGDPERGAGPHRVERVGLQLVPLVGAMVAVAFAVYAPSLQIGLLSDDFVIARWAERLELVHFEDTGFVRPGVPLFWGMLQRLPGDFAITAHAANTVLHGVNAALVATVAGRLGLRRSEAFAAAALFVLFAGLSEAIAWLAGVQDVLMTTFVLAAVTLATTDEPRIVGAVAASAAALAVKETAVVSPVLAALIMWGRDGLGVSRRKRVALVALAAVSAIYVVARATAGLPSSLLDVADWRYFVKQLLANAFATLGAPWTVEWGRTHAWFALMRAVSIVVLLGAAFFRWRRGDATFRAAAACAAWVLAGVLPVFSLFYVGPQLEGARYVYLPAAGFTILLALLIGLAANHLAIRVRPAAIGLMTAILTVPFLPAITSDLRRWERAAVVRGEILERAGDQSRRWGCTTFTTEGAADSVSGAYVFRHGLAEALSGWSGDRSVPCRVVMKSGELEVARERAR